MRGDEAMVMSISAYNVTLPHSVQVIEGTWIPLADGTRLAARLWVPEGAEVAPVPALLEYLPYRRRDFMRARDTQIHGYFAGHGYACLRVDIRGTGDSEGYFDDEYSAQEHADAVEVIAWIAAQPWCCGQVGMFGNSWGGFNALQVAALRPPALSTIVTCCASDDRYADDIHYMGGCVLVDHFLWAAAMFGRLTLPPDPAIVGDGWRQRWLERLEAHRPLLATWLGHQRRDTFWRHGSVCEDYAAIACPVLALGGWADSYTNAIPRLLAGLRVPRLGIIGPWAHGWGFMRVPGPQVGILQEVLRWWDYWLKGIDTGIMAEPMLRAWMQESVSPAPGYTERPGRWVAEPVWPPQAGIVPWTCWLNRDGIGETPGRETLRSVSSPQETGLAGGEWCAHGSGTDLPDDQRVDDAGSIVFDTAPLPERLELFGAPVVRLVLAVDQPQALIAVRLCDVAPDGASARVSFGILNLTHRESHETLQPMVPGTRSEVTVHLNDVAQAIPAGHCLRVAISSTYWPMVWPSPQRVRLSVYAGASRVTLPIRRPRREDAMVHFDPPESAPPVPRTVLEPPVSSHTVTRDIASGETTVEIVSDQGRWRFDDIALEMGSWRREQLRITAHDPLSAQGEVRYDFALGRGTWRVRTETHSRLAVDTQHFIMHNEVEAWEGDIRVFSRSFELYVPRDGV
jgi:putative CocE/NonD family hydrolase